MVLPLGLERGIRNRLPWATMAIALACVGGFLTGTIKSEENIDKNVEAAAKVVSHWKTYPYLELPDEFIEEYMLAKDLENGARYARVLMASKQAPDEQEIKRQSLKLDLLLRSMNESTEDVRKEQSGLIPADGYKQKGMWTYNFLFRNFAHLLLFLIILYCVGPYIEDVWGPFLTAIFYVACIPLVGAVLVKAHGHIYEPVVGAGAVFGLVGAFFARFALHKVRIRIWAYVYDEIIAIPAWVIGLVVVAAELIILKAHALSTSNSFLAYTLAMGTGAVVAVALQVLHLESFLSMPGKDIPLLSQTHRALDEARRAVEKGDKALAKGKFVELLKNEPKHLEAAAELLELAMPDNDQDAGTVGLQCLLSEAKTPQDVNTLLMHYQGLLQPTRVKTTVALRVAEIMEQTDPKLSDELYRSVIGRRGTSGPMLRAAELNLNQLKRPDIAIELAQSILAKTEEGTAANHKAQELLLRAQQEPLPEDNDGGMDMGLPLDNAGYGAPDGGIPLDDGGLELDTGGDSPSDDGLALGTEARPSAPQSAPGGDGLELGSYDPSQAPVQPTYGDLPDEVTPPVGGIGHDVRFATFVGRSGSGFKTVTSGGEQVSLEPNAIDAVAVGIVKSFESPEGPQKNVLVIDVVTEWDDIGGHEILRFGSHNLGLASLFPSGTPPKEAYQTLLAELSGAGNAKPLPSRNAVVAGAYVKYADTMEFETAVYI